MAALYAWGIRGHALTAVQGWKDVLLLVALARLATDAAHERRLPFRPRLPDALALAFAGVVVLYALIPQSALGGDATHRAIAYALRHDLAGVGAYFLGRSLATSLRTVGRLVLAVAAIVAVWGLIDVYAIDLDWWRTNGTVGYFRKQLGYPYGNGLSGLPENFVYNNGNESELTRRLVSVFLSPLASAYLFVVALLLGPRTRAAIPLLVLAAAGLLWTHTRAAIIGLALGFVVLAAVSRRTRPLVAAAATLAVGFVSLAVYSDIGARAHFTPAELKVQRAHASTTGPTTLEPSAESHWQNLKDGIDTVLRHPQGYGLGNAGEVAFRENVPVRAGESNYTELGVEAGLLGVLLFVAWNVSLLLSLAAARQAALAAVLAAVLFIAIQTDAYGIPWLAYCVWWLAGAGLRRETEWR
jgi:O-Antigen ligase